VNSTPTDSRRSPGRRNTDTLLRRVVEIAHLGGWQVDLEDHGIADANPLHWSDEVYRIFGYEPRAFPASNEAFFARVHPDDVEPIREAVRQALENGTAYEIEHRIVRPDGTERIVEERARIECSEDGRPLRLVGTVLDITDRRRIEEALTGGDAGSRLLSQLVEHSHDAIISATLDGVITTWNPAAELVFGWKTSEIVGRPLSVLVPPDRQHELETHLDLAGRAVPRGAYETTRVRRDGSLVDVEISLSPIIDATGTAIGASAIIRDITQQKRLAAQLQHSQRLESVGRLAGGVAHDFNNMLMAITGYAELVLMDLPADSPSREDLRELLSSAERGARLTRQLLAFGRRQVLHPVPLDLNAVLRDIEGILRPLTSSDVSLRLRLSTEPALVVADRAQIEQVVVNLVANARDAMAHGGSLDIETSVVDIGADGALPHPSIEPGRYVRLAVRDTGIGMDADVQSRLFEPFFSTKPRGTSTGMGLATAYGIVKQSGGFITVESAPEHGSTLRVFLPLRPAGATTGAAVPGRAVQQPGGTNQTVLLVEDDEAVRHTTKALLERMGYTVLDAGTPSAALRLLREQTAGVDLVLTDILLPEMSGIRLAETIRADHPDIAIVCMSGYPDATDRDGLEPGVNYLSKPFAADTLARVLRSALNA
jgi:PAS domain S-box-containing protein